MARSRSHLSALVLALVMLTGAVIAWARDAGPAAAGGPAASDAPGPPGNANAGSAPIRLAGGGVSLDQAIKMAEQRYKARVVRAESQKSDGRTVYVLRMLNEHGRVWTVRVDASNGSVL